MFGLTVIVISKYHLPGNLPSVQVMRVERQKEKFCFMSEELITTKY